MRDQEQRCDTAGCGQLATSVTRFGTKDDPKQIWHCEECAQFRRATGVDGPEGDQAKAGVMSLRAMQGRGYNGGVKGEPLHGAAHWSWLPYNADGEKRQNPIHAKNCNYASAPKGHAPKRQELVLDLEQLAERLTPEQRQPLLMQVFEGLSYEAIAIQLGVAVVTVRERLRRARERLRELST